MSALLSDVSTRIRFDENGLVPAIVRDAASGAVLTLAYMNHESVARTIESGETWFWSRSRKELWNKGATSGNRQRVIAIALDCDGDALLVDVEPAGPACHTGAMSCFGTISRSAEALTSTSEAPITRSDAAVISTSEARRDPSHHQGPLDATFLALEATLLQRKRDLPEGSYSAYLFKAGTDKILKKIGEEATEVVIAAKGESRERLVSEVADLLYHLTALLVNEGVSLRSVEEELRARSDPE